MDVHHLRSFVAVAEELHFGRAAERLHLTPSPVSRAIKELEREFGLDLFVRRYHHVELTRAGAQLLGRARAVLASFDELRTTARAAAAAPGPLRLGGTPLAAPAVLDLVIAAVERLHPGLEYDVTIATSVDLLPAMARGELDLAVVHLPVDLAGVTTLALARYSYAVAMRADDALAAAPTLTLAEIADRPIAVAPAQPQPLAMAHLHDQLRAAGLRRMVMMPTTDVVHTANYVVRTGALALTLDCTDVFSARVYADPAFAVVPLRNDEIDFQVGLAWRPADAVRSAVLRSVIAASREARGAELLRL